jgi:hypothetical protein
MGCRYHQQLTAAREERALRSLLPPSAAQAFMAEPADAQASKQQRTDALLSVRTHSAAMQ